MCSVKTLQKFTDSVVPKCESFVCSDTGKTLGKFYPVKDTICISGNMKIQQNIIKENFFVVNFLLQDSPLNRFSLHV